MRRIAGLAACLAVWMLASFSVVSTFRWTTEVRLKADTTLIAQQQPQRPPQPQPDDVVVRSIAAPARPLPTEAESARVTRFSFIAYGDTRSSGPSRSGEPPEDGRILQREHSLVVDSMVKATKRLADTAFPVRFVVSSGDAVLYGPNGAMWNVSYVPLVDRLTREARLPFFFAPGNHDTTTRPLGDPEREHGLRNTLRAMSNLMPADGSPRRLDGYPTYAFGYGNAFFIILDSDIPTDEKQLTWVTKQLEGLNRARYIHVFAVFHHPPFDSGAHGGDMVEPQSAAIRAVYLPLFRKHHVRATLCGHDHLLDHFVERYEDGGRSYRMDHIVSGGGGAPTYTYREEPNLQDYVSANASQKVSVEHIMKPGPRVEDNPHHFLIVRVDGARLSLEVVGTAPSAYVPYGRTRLDLN
jgi:3',5'-cyclic AMP phosphodiesterase CpdA